MYSAVFPQRHKLLNERIIIIAEFSGCNLSKYLYPFCPTAVVRLQALNFNNEQFIAD